MGIRQVSGADPLQISHDLIEWRGRLEGLDGLLLLLFLMFFCSYEGGREAFVNTCNPEQVGTLRRRNLNKDLILFEM